MLQLYYSPGACSLAVHIALIEAQIPHRLQLVNTQEGEHLRAEYRAIHPLARIPALRTPEGHVLTEVAAILGYVDALSQRPLLPREVLLRARAFEWMSLFGSAVHPAFVTFFRPERFTPFEDTQSLLRRDGREHFWQMLEYVEQRLPGGDSVLAEPSLVDGYASVFYLWGLRTELPMRDLKKYSRLARSVLQRPSAQLAIEREGLTPVVAPVVLGTQPS